MFDFGGIADLISSLVGGGGADTATSAASTAGSAGGGILDFITANPGASLQALSTLGGLGLSAYNAANPALQQLPPAQFPQAPLLAGTAPRRGMPTADYQAAGLSGASPDFFTLMNQRPASYNPYSYSFQPGGQAPWPYGATGGA